MAFEFSHQAERDLAEITHYLERHFPGRVKSTYARIKAVCCHLVTHPKIGRVGRIPQTREFAMPDLPYVIVYREQPRRLTILRVYHMARRPLGH